MRKGSQIRDRILNSARQLTKSYVGAGIGVVTRRSATRDIVAGLTLAALGIPEVMGYAQIAGMPIQAGIATLLLPVIVFALLGSSRHLVVGADSATAAIMAAGLAPLAPAASAQYVALAGMLAIITGAFLILGRLLRVGFLADFLSRSVLIGFLTGVGIHIAWQQLPKMLGVASVQSDLASISWATAGLSAAIVSFVVVSRFISKRIPAALIAIIASIVLGAIGNLSSHGVELLGSVPSGLPKFGLPHGAWSAMPHLWGIAGAMFLVILAQSAGTASAYANRYRESVDENRDLLALGLSNIAAGFTGTFVVNGSPTKSEMVDDAGGRSQLAMLSTAGVVVIVLLALTRPLEFLPTAALASVVFMIGVGLIDVAGLRQVLQMRRNEFFVAFITMLTVVFVGIEQGVVLAMILSVINHLRRSYRPNDTVLTLGADGHLHAVPLHDGVPISPGVVVYHFSASIYFANAERFRNEVLALSGIDGGAIKIVVIDASGIADIDYSGGQMMLELVEQLAERDVRMVIANAPADVRREFIIYGVADLLGENSNFETVSSALRAFRNN
ncbi:MAG: STAS domain-containing protein [Actinobacteria bacterium]|uniref:Unannotated protein n=1 Tax=freshwater metagenome TaxID=449393 RepID=A0A6J7DLE8_9ZZZZ|nr:STAS domain-containing protein [Actinomycetota bacterium]